MRLQVHLFACAFGALVLADPAAAKTARLQTVTITDRHLSLEGGEARLYRIHEDQRRYCRIEVIHLGEMGRRTDVFDFGPKLMWAERRKYRYSAYFTDPNRKDELAERTTWGSAAARTELRKDFEEAKTFFDARRLASCLKN